MEQLHSMILDYLSYCRIGKNLSPKTISAYQLDLFQFHDYLIKNGNRLTISQIGKNEIRSYIDSLSQLKPKSIKRKIASLKAWLNYLEFEETLTINPFRKMRVSIKEPRLLPKSMDMSEIGKIIRHAYLTKDLSLKADAPEHYRWAIRDIAVIELLFGTGCRVSELAGLSIQSVNLNSGVIQIMGKGNKERIIQICNIDSLSLLRQYSSLFSREIERCGMFLINKRNGPVSDQSIRRLVKHICAKAGIDKKVTPHMFRHTFATLLLEADVDIKYIQTLLGHSSIATTQIYTHVNKEKQREILESKHPRQFLRMSRHIE